MRMTTSSESVRHYTANQIRTPSSPVSSDLIWRVSDIQQDRPQLFYLTADNSYYSGALLSETKMYT
jgi:hypothetical protein